MPDDASGLKIHETKTGCQLDIKVSAGASRNAIAGTWNGRLKISISTPPEKGKANKAIIAFLAKSLGLPRQAITLQSGHTGNKKTLQITGLSAAQLQIKINALL